MKLFILYVLIYGCITNAFISRSVFRTWKARENTEKPIRKHNFLWPEMFCSTFEENQFPFINWYGFLCSVLWTYAPWTSYVANGPLCKDSYSNLKCCLCIAKHYMTTKHFVSDSALLMSCRCHKLHVPFSALLLTGCSKTVGTL